MTSIWKKKFYFQSKNFVINCKRKFSTNRKTRYIFQRRI